MEIDRESFRRMFPHLFREMESGDNKITLNSVRTDMKSGEDASFKDLSEFIPGVIDFIRRCDNDEQAREIINYMRSRGEIDAKYAERLLKQLRDKGLRSFGSKKEDGYYFWIAEKEKYEGP